MNEEERTEARGDSPDWNGPAPRGRPATVALADLSPDPYVPTRFLCKESIEAARAEIDSNGLLRPLLVRPSDDTDGRYWVFAGARMLEALKASGVEEVQVQIFNVTPSAALWLASAEQEARAEWSPIRKARFVFRMVTQPDGDVDEEALQRCRRIFATGSKKALGKRRVQQMRQVGEVFSEQQATARGVGMDALAGISGRKLIWLSQRPDPWGALRDMLAPDADDESEPKVHVEVRNGRDGKRTVVLSGDSPEAWSDEDTELFVETIGPVWAAIRPDQPDTESTSPEVPEESTSDDVMRPDDYNELLRRYAYLATELAAARSVIASYHASRAVMEQRRADAAEAADSQSWEESRKRWGSGLRNWMRNAFRDTTKRVSLD